MRFSVTLRLDTPLLLGGAEAKQCDRSQMLRVPSVRGLLHTFARAMIAHAIGPTPRVRELEARLLGAAADDKEATPTCRIAVLPGARLSIARGYPNSPRDPANPQHRKDRSTRDGFVPEAEQRIEFRIRRNAVDGDRKIGRALYALAWTSFALGSLGNRSRRGYGSLSITTTQATGIDQVDTTSFPTFDNLSDDRDLALRLNRGLAAAEDAFKSWTGVSSPAGGYPAKFFWYQGRHLVFVGKATRADRRDQPWQQPMIDFMEEAHKQLNLPIERGITPKDKSARAAAYKAYIGSSSPRLASPVWMRIYQTRAGWVPVVTVAPLADEAPEIETGLIIEALLDSGDCQSLEELIGGAP